MADNPMQWYDDILAARPRMTEEIAKREANIILACPWCRVGLEHTREEHYLVDPPFRWNRDLTAIEYELRFGLVPQDDDLERVNCKQAGTEGHRFCGVCKTHKMPRFECSCPMFMELK